MTDDALVRIDDIIKQAVSSDEKFTIVYPIPADYIWQKILYFPSYLNPQQQYKQAIQILKQELPIPLTEVYFDIQSSLDTKSNRIKTTIYVLKKSYGEPFLGKSNVILDNELFCYVRGIAALNETDQEHLSELQNKDIEQLSFPENILDKKLYLIALGASLWNGKVSI
ncbi:hypothetical protein A1D26_01685 [Ursidibacter maritimus]|nr:hypothetical protein A1D26_01685 [Ursidibacter maritimus]